MEPDFTEIKDKRVGYRIRVNHIGDSIWLETLTFGEFIPPYASGAETPQEVYRNLAQSLESNLEQQDSVTNWGRPVMLNVLATAALQREAMTNSMALIRTHYL